jgi:hypothetical protein
LSDYAHVRNVLPFGRAPSAVAALLLRQVLLAPDDYGMECSTPEARLTYLQTTLFPSIANLRHHLRRVFDFLLQALLLLLNLKAADPQMVSPALESVLPTAMNLVQHKLQLHFPDA